MVFETRDALTAFIYTLIERHLPAYTMDDILKLQSTLLFEGNAILLENGNLAQYADDIASQITLNTRRMKQCAICEVNDISEEQPQYCSKCYRPLCLMCANIYGHEVRCSPCISGQDHTDSLGRTNIDDI